MKIILDIDPAGDVHCLYTEEIDLFSLGRVTNVRKASNVEFNQDNQTWEVLSLCGKVLHQNCSRVAAIDWGIEAFSSGGMCYDPMD